VGVLASCGMIGKCLRSVAY